MRKIGVSKEKGEIQRDDLNPLEEAGAYRQLAETLQLLCDPIYL